MYNPNNDDKKDNNKCCKGVRALNNLLKKYIVLDYQHESLISTGTHKYSGRNHIFF